MLSGYQIPKNTFVFRVGALSSTDENNFKEANKFLPERWLRGNLFIEYDDQFVGTILNLLVF